MFMIDPYRFGSSDLSDWEIVFESGLGEGKRGYAVSFLAGGGALISANTDEIIGVYSSPSGSGYWFEVAIQSDSEIPEDPPFSEVQIFESPDFSGDPRLFLAEDIVSSDSWAYDVDIWVRTWMWNTPGENLFSGHDGDVFSCRLIRS